MGQSFQICGFDQGACRAIYCVFVVLLLFGGVSARRFPSYVRICHQSDPHFHSCLTDAARTVTAHFDAGIPEFSLPPMNPLILPEIQIKDQQGFKAGFTKVNIYNINNMQVKNLKLDLNQSSVDMDVTFPNLRIQSEYNVEGKLLIMQVRGHGSADGNFSDVQIHAKLTGHKYKRHGKEYIRFTNLDFQENRFKAFLYFDGIFPNNEELSKQTNKLVNENIWDIMDEFKPSIHTLINATVIGLLRPMFSVFPLRELFPKYS